MSAAHHLLPSNLDLKAIISCYNPTRNVLQDLSRSCKIYPEQTFKNLIRVFLQDLERFLQESYKILQEQLRSYKNLLECSCKIHARILQDM